MICCLRLPGAGPPKRTCGEGEPQRRAAQHTVRQPRKGIPMILVTGATEGVGSELIDLLACHPQPVRAMTYQPAAVTGRS